MIHTPPYYNPINLPDSLLILQIDASSELCSVALAQKGELLGMKINSEPYQHGRDMNLLMEGLLEDCQVNFRDLQAVSVNRGPGSYTALRIGMATAKGLCFGLDIPLLTPTGFEILIDFAMKNHSEAEYYVPMIDARRMEVYTVSPVSSLETELEHEALVLDQQSFSRWSENRLCFIGNGVDKWKTIWPDKGVWTGISTEIDAGMMTGISHQYSEKNFISNLFTTVPLYLKKPNITQSKKEYFN